MIGETIGSYEITGVLGHGMQGTVYAGRHRELPRQAAVKVLLPQLTRDEVRVSRFFDEARAAASIRHPGVVEVLDCGRDEQGRVYIVMERLGGETLFERLRRAPLPIAEAVEILRQLADALAAAHDHIDSAGRPAPIVHRDLKPENIFLAAGEASARVVIVDFGIAKLSPSARAAGTLSGAGVFGTPPYMSPEQFQQDATIDHRTDLYALGCLLHEMITGTPPFGFGGIRELSRAHCEQEPPPLGDGELEVPELLSELAARLLCKDPAARPASARAVLEALHALEMAPARLVPARSRPLSPAATVEPEPRTWRGRIWKALVETSPGGVAAVSCVVGASLLGLSTVVGVGDSYIASPNWGFTYVVLVPLITSLMVKSIQRADAGLRAMASVALEGDVGGPVAEASRRLGHWLIGLAAIVGMISVLISAGEWLHRYRREPIPGTWWSESAMLGACGAIVQGLFIAAIIAFVLYALAWTQLVHSWTSPRSRLRLRRPAASRAAFESLSEPVELIVVIGLLVQIALYLSNVQHVAERSSAGFVDVLLTMNAPLDLLDVGSGRYPSTTVLVASAMVAGFLAASLLTIRRAMTAYSGTRLLSGLGFAPAIGLPFLALVGTVFYRLGPLILGVITAIAIRRVRSRARAPGSSDVPS